MMIIYLMVGEVWTLIIIFDDGTTKQKEFIPVDIPDSIKELHSDMQAAIRLANNIDLESILIQLSIYYIMATAQENQILKLSDCSKLLKDEMQLANEGNTFFYFEGIEHIVNNLAKNFSNIDKELYFELLNNSIVKINYFNHIVRENHLMNIASEEDVEQLANEIINFSKSFDELKYTFIKNAPAMYELGNRYYYSNMYEEAYNHYQQSAQNGYTKAIFMKILCMYNGEGTIQNQEQAFIELNKLVEESVYTKGKELLGEMYFYGRGTKQNYKKALECFKDVENEESIAQYFLGIMYINGYGIDKDTKKGIDYIIKSAKQRCKQAIDYIIGKNYNFYE